MGGAVMLLFFAAIGAAAGSLGALLHTGWLAAFIGLQLGVHMAFTLGLGCLARLPMEVLAPLPPAPNCCDQPQPPRRQRQWWWTWTPYTACTL